jgi:hypothetical protein
VACGVLEAVQTGASWSFTVVVKFVRILNQKMLVYVADINNRLLGYAPLPVHSWRTSLVLEMLEKCCLARRTCFLGFKAYD